MSSEQWNWGQLISLALVGNPVVNVDTPNVAKISNALLAVGWGSEEISTLRTETLAAGRTWPFPVPPKLLAAIGSPAQFQSVLSAVRETLGLAATLRPAHRGPKVLGPDEQRLLAELPPHHGFVG